MNQSISNQCVRFQTGVGGRSHEASKTAVLQFTRFAAADWAACSINVTAICPSLIMTDTNQRLNETKPEVIDKPVAGNHVDRSIRPEDIGPLAVFLANSASNYITGAARLIDGVAPFSDL